jgi:hypothetical protein
MLYKSSCWKIIILIIFIIGIILSITNYCILKNKKLMLEKFQYFPYKIKFGDFSAPRNNNYYSIEGNFCPPENQDSNGVCYKKNFKIPSMDSSLNQTLSKSKQPSNIQYPECKSSKADSLQKSKILRDYCPPGYQNSNGACYELQSSDKTSQLINNMQNNMPNNIANNMKNNMANNMPNNIANNMKNNMANNMPNNIANKYSNDFSKDKNGNKLCLDSDQNNQILMTECSDTATQNWITKPIENMPNFYNIQNMKNKSENRCVDIINDGINNKLTIEPCGNYTGQQWLIPDNNSSNFKNNFSGMNNCLDIINDGINNKLIMNPCGNYSGQEWSINKN